MKTPRRETLFTDLLRALGIPFTARYAARAAEEAPHGHSLLGLAHLLRHYGIASQGFRLRSKAAINELPPVFVAQVGEELVVVLAHTANRVTYLSANHRHHVRTADFCAQWTGIILLAAPDARSGEPGYALHRRQAQTATLRRWLAAFCCAALLILGVSSRLRDGDWALCLLASLHGVGLVLSLLLLAEQLHRPRPIGERLCGLVHQGGCRSVLTTAEARPFGLFSWSETGAAYFGVSLLVLLFAPGVSWCVGWLGVGAVLYSLWSVWYQWRRAHAWCVLCLLVQALFWLQLAANAATGILLPPAHIDGASIALLMLSYAGALLPLNFGMEWKAKALQLRDAEKAHRAFRLNGHVFAALWRTSPLLAVDDTASRIVFGHPDAPVRLTVYSNPYCHPCAAMHRRLERLVWDDEVCIQYVFTSFRPELDIVNRYWVAAYQKLGAERCWELLTQWFEGGKREGEAFFTSFGLNPEAPDVTAELNRQDAWRAVADLHATPRILVNGRLLPPAYRVEDLPHLWATIKTLCPLT